MAPHTRRLCWTWKYNNQNTITLYQFSCWLRFCRFYSIESQNNTRTIWDSCFLFIKQVFPIDKSKRIFTTCVCFISLLFAYCSSHWRWVFHREKYTTVKCAKFICHLLWLFIADYLLVRKTRSQFIVSFVVISLFSNLRLKLARKLCALFDIWYYSWNLIYQSFFVYLYTTLCMYNFKIE